MTLTIELASLERWKNTIDLHCSGKRGHCTFSAILNRILSILAGKEDKHKNLMGLNFGQIPPLNIEWAALQGQQN